MNLRDKLLNNPTVVHLWSLYRGWKQAQTVHEEAQYYARRAEQMGLPANFSDEAVVWQALKDKLASRGIQWPPRKDKPHIVYATMDPTVWEGHNIPPQIEKIGDCSCFFLNERPGYQEGWSLEKKRALCDQELLAFFSKLQQEKPVDLLLSYLPGGFVSADVIRQVGEMGVATFYYNLDDRISFRGIKVGEQWSGAASLASAYDMCLTPSDDSLIKYHVEGGLAGIWPEGANPEHFKPLDLPFEYDVSFIGQRYGRRVLLIDYLRKHGIKVACFGPGWEHGMLTAEQMVEVYAKSRINLGFGYIGYSKEPQLKGRDFEVPACRALYLTTHNRYLPMVYEIGKEILTFQSHRDCLKQIQHYLANPEAADAIREAGYRRVLGWHTWEKRIRSLLQEEFRSVRHPAYTELWTK